MYTQLSPVQLQHENQLFAGTGGISQCNHDSGFIPAFRDSESGRVCQACFRDGRPAPMHVLDGLPEAWVRDRLPSGRVTAVKDTVVSGFLRQGRFYTRQQAAAAVAVKA